MNILRDVKELKENDKSYHPPETINIDYCAAVLAVVFKQHPQAKDLFENIKHCIQLPGVQDTFNGIERKIPDGNTILKSMVTKAGYSNKKAPTENNPAKISRNFILGTLKLIKDYRKRLWLWIMSDKRRRSDLKTFAKSIDTFIRVCFNRESDRVKGNYKITGSTSNIIAILLLVRAISETNKKYRQIFKRMGKIPMFKHGNKMFNVETALDGKMSALAQRELINQYLDAGFKLKHNKKIETAAWRRYQSH